MNGDRFRRHARAASTVATLLGGTVLIGWVLDIDALKSVLPGLITMKVNPAILFVLAGTSLMLQVRPGSPPWPLWTGRVCAWVAVAVAGLTLAEYVFGFDAGIDQLLIRAPAGEVGTSSPGRMAPITALNFFFLGIALALLDTGDRKARCTLQALTVVVLLTAFTAICGYMFGASPFYGIAGLTSVALHTAAGLEVLSLGVLFARPERGIMAALARTGPAGQAARRILPPTLVTPLATGWMVLSGQQAGLYGTPFALALLVTATTSILAAFVLWNAGVQGRLQRDARQRARLLEGRDRRTASDQALRPRGP